MTVRRIRTTAATAALLTGVAACSAPGDNEAGGGADSVVIGVASEPDTLSPLLGYGKDGNSKV
ncbi:ABC transporter substrate-binding protein, partial [Streptomyces sp. NPDC059374]